MEGPEFAGTQPSEVRWSVDGQRVYFRWKTTTEKKDGVYVTDVIGRTPRRLSDAEEREAPPSAGIENTSRTKKLYLRDGDIYLLDLKTGSQRRMTATLNEESDPGFTLNPDHIYFTQEGNLYLLSISTGVVEQMTDFRRGPAPREAKPTPSQKFLENEQKDLFKSVQEELEDKKTAEEKKIAAERLKPFYFEARQSARSLQLSPDEKVVTFILDQEPEGTKTAIIRRTSGIVGRPATFTAPIGSES